MLDSFSLKSFEKVFSTMKLFILLILGVYLVNAQNQCRYYKWGMTEQGKQDVVEAHNKYRQMIMDGKDTGQPKGKNLKTLKYDDALGKAAKLVSQQCEMSHVKITDSRWNSVGQNLHIAWSSQLSTEQNWQSAVDDWWSEKQYYDYNSNQSTNSSKSVLHYTQVVWADTEYVGCDFIVYYDSTKPLYPYASLYTCNYGPGGNMRGQKPYKLA